MSTIKVTNLRHESATSDNISLTSTNRVGVGTSSPSVVVEAQAAQAELQLKSTSGTNSAGLRFVPGGETNALYIYADGSRNITIDNHATTIASFRAGGGLTFNGDTAAANALSDYEEGTWTPVLKDNSGNEATMTTQEGFYTKTGNIVNAWFQVAWSSLGSLTGNVRIEGWPVTSKANTSNYYYIGATISNQTTVGCIAMAGNGTVANMQPLTGPSSNQTGSNLSSSGRMMCSLTYLS